MALDTVRQRRRRGPLTARLLLASSLAISATSVAVAVAPDADHRVDAAAASPLPFDMPGAASLRSSGKMVFAHYLPAFPVSIDNAPAAQDYYSLGYLSADGEDSKHSYSGGFFRERPLPRAVNPSSAWALDDMKTEVSRAIAAGIDGFSFDILSLDGTLWRRVGQMMRAAQAVDPDFKVMLVPDVSAGVTDDSDELAAAIAGLAANPAAYRLADGRLVVSPFWAEGKSAAWWQTWIATMRTRYGIEVAFVPMFLDHSAARSLESISYGFSVWGDRSPATAVGYRSKAADAHARGKIWMQPVAMQDVRPYAGIFDESNNTETFRAMWDAAVDGNADWVQLITWNDYSEGTEIAPSSNIGWGPLDLTAYQATRFKTGTTPPVVRDTLYLSHRVQHVATRPTGAQTLLMSSRPGSTAPRNTVEVLSFLRAPQTITIAIGAGRYTYAAPAGVYAHTVSLGLGEISARVIYADGSSLLVVSPDRVLARPAVQDLQYHFATSGRDGLFSTANAESAAILAAAAQTAAWAVGEAPVLSAGG